ncbi:hypothetical protein RQP46_007029 [Phenoliferia psychrophenolica]
MSMASSESWTRPSPHLKQLSHLKASQSGSAGAISFLQRARQSVPLSLLRFVLKTLQSYLLLVILSPATIFTDPLSTFAMFFMYPVIIVGLFIATADPTLFDASSKAVIDSAIPLLGGGTTTIPQALSLTDDLDPTTKRLFSLPLARTFLLFSAIVYERNNTEVTNAVNLLASGNEEGADNLLKESEGVIRKVAKMWDLRFEGISDLSTVGGPYASIFYSKKGTQAPWITLVFKGTSTDNFAEFLVDASITRTSGFYSDLFPQNTGGANGCRICSRIREVAAKLHQENPTSTGPIPLWVTGHSLGSALAALTYARFMHEPKDLGSDIVLRDSYVYGTPRLGDGEFASKFEESVNNWDIVCRVPPGLADDSANRGLLGRSVLNYGHIGVETMLRPLSKPFYSIQKEYFRAETHVMIDDPTASFGRAPAKPAQGGRNPLEIALSFVPAPLFNHFPGSYWANLNLVDPTIIATAFHVPGKVLKA